MNTCIFTTHTTLDLNHADYSLKALLLLQDMDIIWDNFVLYNTHEHEVSNEEIIKLIKKYDVNHYVKDILIFPYNPEENKKNLLQDIRNWYNIGLSLELQHTPRQNLLVKIRLLCFK
jgi:hypothetical protein